MPSSPVQEIFSGKLIAFHRYNTSTLNVLICYIPNIMPGATKKNKVQGLDPQGASKINLPVKPQISCKYGRIIQVI